MLKETKYFKTETEYLKTLEKSLPENLHETFRTMSNERRKNPWLTLGLACGLPFAAADRFYLGDSGIAILKIIYFPIVYGICSIYINLLKLKQSFTLLGGNSNFLGLKDASPENLGLFYALLITPYVWMVVDAIFSVPNTIKHNKREVDEIYFRLIAQVKPNLTKPESHAPKKTTKVTTKPAAKGNPTTKKTSEQTRKPFTKFSNNKSIKK